MALFSFTRGATWLAAALAGAAIAPAIPAIPPTLSPGVTGSSRNGSAPLLIPVQPLGFQVLPPKFRSTLATMQTLQFVDETHLLFTFTVRTLMPRLPDAEENDNDRNVAALLLELPTGKVLARAEWRTRDQDRYLWPLEHGRFLLRVRSKLSVIDPLRNLEKGDAFAREPLLSLDRPIGFLQVSPGGDLLSVETVAPRKKKLVGASASAAALAATDPDAKPGPILQVAGKPPVQIHFYRLAVEHGDGSGPLTARVAGLVATRELINLPATAEGFLDTKKESNASWTFDFVTHAGKRSELSAYDTSCVPRPYFISRSEFVAFGCRGAEDRVQLSYFNLKGEEPWLAVLQGTQVSPSITSAPAAGRFALSRTLINSTLADTDNLTADDLQTQEISVLQNSDGRVLLKVQANPIQRSGQNYDLSPSGQKFVVLRSGNLEIYTLPALSGKDAKAVQFAQSLVPGASDALIRLSGAEIKDASGAVDAEQAAAPAPPPPPLRVEVPPAVPAAALPAIAPATPLAAAALPASESIQQTSTPQPALGDPQFGERNAPPSLYTPDHPRAQGDPRPSKQETPQ